MTLPVRKSIFFKVLLNRFHPTSGETILKSLPQVEAKEIFKQLLTSPDAAAAIGLAEELISRTHYSWLVPVIQKMPKELQGITVAALPEPQSSKLKHFLNLKHLPVSLAPSVKSFVLNQLYVQWRPQEALPLAYLPPSPLQALLQFSKHDLVELIDFLSLYDLSDAIRHIVDKKYLKKIYFYLDAHKQQFLRICLHKNEKITVPKLNIEKWDGNSESLKHLLHKRGLFRLGKTLCGQSPLFVWHLIHILDTGRGATLLSYYKEAEIPGITPILLQQILAVVNFLNLKGET